MAKSGKCFQNTAALQICNSRPPGMNDACSMAWNKNACSILKMLQAFHLHKSVKNAAVASRLATLRVTPLSASA
jgi:hypothetical protein